MAYIFNYPLGGKVKLKSIAVTTPPSKTVYKSGEAFSPADMVITATYSNGTTKQVVNYSYSPTTALTDGLTAITITYTEEDITVTTQQPITVTPILTGISVSQQPTKSTYNYGETFSSVGMQVTATYSNGSSKLVSGWTTPTPVLTTLGNQNITVTFAEGGITKTTTVVVKVNAIAVNIPAQSNTLTYNGKAQAPTWSNYNTAQLTLGGTTSGTNATSYTATFTPKYGYMWADGTSIARNVNWTINRATITTIPSQSGSLTYTGSTLSPTWSNYNSAQLTIGGTTSAANAGTYTATFTPTSNYQWSGAVITGKSVTWTIGRKAISVPYQSNTLTYTGSSQSPTWANYSSASMTISGTTTASNAGTYTATFTPTSNYQWSSGSTSAQSVNWSIGRATISNYPSPSNPTYNGYTQSPNWAYYNSSQLTISGTTSATNVGLYTATFTPTSNYQWSNGSTSGYSVYWRIYQASGKITLGATAVTLSQSKKSVSVSVSGTGLLSVSSSSTSVGVTLSGNTITISAKEISNGDYSVTVSAAESTNYYSAVATISVYFDFGLAGDSWYYINYIASLGGMADTYAIGDTKSIEFTDSRGTIDAFIVEINDQYAIFQIGKLNGKLIALSTATTYYSQSILPSRPPNAASYSKNYLAMNSTATNTTGYSNSDMVNNILCGWSTSTGSGLMGVLPDDLRNYMAKMSLSWVDNDTEERIWTDEYLGLPSEREYFGTDIYGNGYASQFRYYANGNSKIHYRDYDTTKTCIVWLRDQAVGSKYNFCAVSTSGTATTSRADITYAIAPIFSIARSGYKYYG